MWIKDANPLEAVRRGCTELWVLWCIGNTPYWGNGPLEQYVHMIELSANSALFADLAEIAAINERRRAGEAVLGSTEAVVVHVVKPEYPLPLDPDYLAGRITSETLVAMGYRDARRYLASMAPAGIALDPSATVMRDPPLGARFTLRASGELGGEPVELSLTGEVTDLAALRGRRPRRARRWSAGCGSRPGARCRSTKAASRWLPGRGQAAGGSWRTARCARQMGLGSSS